MDLSPNLAGEIEVGIQRLPVLAVYVRLFHTSHQKLSMEALGVAAATFDHGLGIAARSNTNQDPLLRAPGFADAVQIHVALELPFDHLRGDTQSQFAESGKLLPLGGIFRAGSDQLFF